MYQARKPATTKRLQGVLFGSTCTNTCKTKGIMRDKKQNFHALHFFSEYFL